MITYTRKGLLVILDILLINLTAYASLLLIYNGDIPIHSMNILIHGTIMITLLKVGIFWLMGMYKSLWQYASTRELVMIVLAVLLSTGADYIFSTIVGMTQTQTYYIGCFLILTPVMGGLRFLYRILRRYRKQKKGRRECGSPIVRRVMVIGAGEAGSMLIKELKGHPELGLSPRIVVDDNKWKHHSNIHGVPVAGPRHNIPGLVKKYKVDDIIFAIPSAARKDISDILNICKENSCKLKTLPGVFEIIDGKVNVSHIRDINIEDLLGRDEVVLDAAGISELIRGEVVLVTGGGGSIGSELCRQIACFSPKLLVILDIYENNAYDIQNELTRTYGKKLKLEVIIASVRDKSQLEEIFAEYRPSVVFHAAAHKHVPLMEKNPSEAIKNNVFGTFNTAQCADKYGVKKFVMISTDKAVNPTNVMGATKRLAEMIVQGMDRTSRTEFVAVRFGNVLGSNGSVIPLFKKQIEAGGPLTITHPEITRFFMTIPEAARLVIQAGAMAKGGEIFVLDMGQPVRIVDLAEDLIRLSGLEPYTDIQIEFVGLRPGEKLYEELMLAEEGVQKTRHEKIFIGKPIDFSYNEVLMFLKSLENTMGDATQIRECLKKIVKTYKPSDCGQTKTAQSRQEQGQGTRLVNAGISRLGMTDLEVKAVNTV